MELTILIPSLNEEKTIEICIKKAKTFIETHDINGEVLISDNGSVDNTREIAKKLGARVVVTNQKGYGAALQYGNKQAKGKYTIMGDADDSYNFLELENILEELRKGNHLVIGNRYKGKMEKGSMKVMHKYIGTPVISFWGRVLYKIQVRDFNCGLRGFVTDEINKLDFESSRNGICNWNVNKGEES